MSAQMNIQTDGQTIWKYNASGHLKWVEASKLNISVLSQQPFCLCTVIGHEILNILVVEASNSVQFWQGYDQIMKSKHITWWPWNQRNKKNMTILHAFSEQTMINTPAKILKCPSLIAFTPYIHVWHTIAGVLGYSFNTSWEGVTIHHPLTSPPRLSQQKVWKHQVTTTPITLRSISQAALPADGLCHTEYIPPDMPGSGSI